MSVKTKFRPLTVEEYLEGELHSDVKHELVGGQAYAMVGVSKAHNLITIALVSALRPHLKRPCQAYVADVKVRVGDDFYYPDLTVTCERYDPQAYFITAPVLIIEVLSGSTERTDRSEKRLAYQRLESLNEYVLVAQDRMDIEVYRRVTDGWELERFSKGDELRLEAVDLTIPLTDIYQDVMNAL
ncbi:MAG: Uma2 family endonuclease [Pseudomonadota bacterium]